MIIIKTAWILIYYNINKKTNRVFSIDEANETNDLNSAL